MTARILVVDDIAANVKLLEAKLSAEYYEVITADNGRAALEIAETKAPDIILLDVMMPGMDGIETLDGLRRLPELDAVPMVFMTAKVQPREETALREAGAVDVIPKPFDPLTLADEVRAIWTRHAG